MTPQLDIIQTLQDSNLLGQFIDDEKTWTAWFTFLKAFFALKPSKEDLSTYKECTGRSEWPQMPSKEAWLVVGTRGGKSFITALLGAFLAVFRRYNLSPGEKGYVLIVAPTKRQSSIIKRYLSSFFYENIFLQPYLVRETSDEIELSNNIIIAVLSSDYRSLRGYTAIACIVDEVAFLSLEGSKPDVEVVRALRSRLTSTGGPLICISSPYAKRGTLYEAFKRHYAKDRSPVLIWQAGSLTMNPTLDEEAIARARGEDPEAAQADFDAQFRSDIESYVTREALEACIIPGRYEVPPIPDTRYFAFCDPSGGSRDSMTLAIAHEESGRRILDLVREVKPPFSPDAVVQDFADDLDRYGITSVTGDRYGGMWPRERFSANGIQYDVSDKSKSDIYKEFLPLVNSAEVELLDLPELINQLVNLERRRGRGGRDSIDHYPGGHDDVANAVAGVLVKVSKRGHSIFGLAGCDLTTSLSPLLRLDNA